MKRPSDRDGKSKTASAVDRARYPEQDEVQHQELSLIRTDHEEIARRAYEIWSQKGRPEGSADEDWFEAAEQLRAQTNSHDVRTQTDSGSVQR